jgi:hypothetical protein
MTAAVSSERSASSGRRQPTEPRGRQELAPAPTPAALPACDCSYPEAHRLYHAPHPRTGRTVCAVCHPVPFWAAVRLSVEQREAAGRKAVVS